MNVNDKIFTIKIEPTFQMLRVQIELIISLFLLIQILAVKLARMLTVQVTVSPLAKGEEGKLNVYPSIIHAFISSRFFIHELVDLENLLIDIL